MDRAVHHKTLQIVTSMLKKHTIIKLIFSSHHPQSMRKLYTKKHIQDGRTKVMSDGCLQEEKREDLNPTPLLHCPTTKLSMK